MRYWLVLLVLSLAACGDDSLTRSFGTNRDLGPEIAAPGQMPLSTPPTLSDRPKRPGLLALNGDTAGQPLSQGPVSEGQDALVQAAGPTAGADVRAKVDDNSGLGVSEPGLRRSRDELDRAAWLPDAGHQGEQRLVQRLVLKGVAIARTSSGEWPAARRSRKVAARSRFASRCPAASVSSGWCA